MQTSIPISLASPPAFTGPLPEAVDVAVIGGGIARVMTAHFLAERGQSVLLCEKGRIAGEQSGRNWGWIRQQGRDPAELPIMVEALGHWKSFAQRLGAEALGFRQTGVMYLADGPEDMETFAAWLPHARDTGVDTRLLSRAEMQAMLPIEGGWPGALWTASDARGEPFVALPALAAMAAEGGVVLREGCAVRALDIAAGRVAGVVTEAGRVACGRVVLAGGAWSALFARAHGVALPQLSVRASVAATVPLPEVFAGGAADGRFAFRRRADGGYSLAPGGAHDFWIGPDALRGLRHYLPQLRRDLRATRFRVAAPAGYPDAWTTPRRWDADKTSPFEACRVLDPAPNMATLSRVQDAFARAFPALGRPQLARAWAGMIDVMPDTVPVLDESPVPGLFLATGLSGHGFGIGPGVGRVMADLVMGNAPGHDLARFRYGRFFDGTAMDLGPAL